MDAQTKRCSAEKRRAVTVETVVQLAAEQNPSTITTTAIAGRMGLTQGALFRHFPTKDAIIESVMEWVAARLLSRVEKAVKKAPSPLAALEAVFMAHIEFVAQHPGVPRILFGELQRAEDTASKRMVQKLIHRYGEQLHGLIEEGKKSRELDADLDTEASVILFIGTIQGLVMQSLLAGNVNRIRREAPRVFAIYQRGIRREK
ncbi:MAG: TetR/AcrR family transcriptional regulator [Desulfobulbaceae bacterium]|nr:TetR/AcrR family transcriptional regulator [Desulfobulbaceae bacterium]